MLTHAISASSPWQSLLIFCVIDLLLIQGKLCLSTNALTVREYVSVYFGSQMLIISRESNFKQFSRKLSFAYKIPSYTLEEKLS